MIKSQHPVSLAEAKEFVSKDNSETMGFINKFTTLSEKDGKEMRKNLVELDLMKLRENQITKIIDILPENNIDLNKIFTDIGLEEDEANKIIEIVKKYK